MIPDFDPETGALPPGDYEASLIEITNKLGFSPRRRWLLKGLREALRAFRGAGIQEIYIDGSFCSEKPDPGDIDGYWVEPDHDVYERLDPYWTDFNPIFAPNMRRFKCRMWVDHGLEFFIHPAMHASGDVGFPDFFRQDRDGRPRGVIQIKGNADD